MNVELGSNRTTRQSAAEASQLCVTSAGAKQCHLCRSQAAFLPPDNITFRVRTNPLGTQSPQGREAQWLSQPRRSQESQGNAAVTPVQHPEPCQTLQSEWGAALMGTIKEGGSCYPPDCTYFPSLTPDLFGMSMGLNFCRSNISWLAFLTKTRGLAQQKCSYIFPPFHQGCNSPLAWLSMPIIKALSSSQGGTKSP